MDFTEFIKPELLVLVPALYGLGMVLKNTEKIKDNYIPSILTVVSILLTCLYVIGTEGVTPLSVFTSIVQGLICVSVAVYSNQLVRQAKSS